MRYVYIKISVTQSRLDMQHTHVTSSVTSLDQWSSYSQNESFWLLSIPEKPKPSGTMIGSVSATRSYFSQTDFFPYFSNWSGAYERHYQRGITRHNKLRNEETKKVNRIFLNIILSAIYNHALIHIHTYTYIPTHRKKDMDREKQEKTNKLIL